MIRRVFGSLYFLTFLNGFLLASLFYFYMEASYEKELFQAIHNTINSKINLVDNQDSVLVKVMHVSHVLLVSRESIFQGKDFEGLKSDLFDPASIDLMTAKGACGSFSIVLARILQGYNFPVRIAQMKSNGIYGKHIIVEAKTSHGWVVLDPLFDIYFRSPSQNLASFQEVKNNWNYYKSQLPPGYDMNYSYEDVRYSNWNKIPILLPAIKKILDITIGKPVADTISLRTYFLKKYTIFFYLILVFFLYIFSFTFIKLIKAKYFPQKNIPATFSNIFKYLRISLFSKGFTEHGQA